MQQFFLPTLHNTRAAKQSNNLSTTTTIFFDVLLTVHLSILISVINQLDAQNFVLQ